MKYKKLILALLLSGIFFSCSRYTVQEKRVVILIGDGMGFEQIRAAEYYNGKEFTVKSKSIYAGSIITLNYSGEVTDSAAGATAMATGEKVSNGVISRRIPGNAENIQTIFEKAKLRRYATGVITTSYIIDATPAAFVSHSSSRYDYEQIVRYLLCFKPELIIGGVTYLSLPDFRDVNYSVYNTIDDYNNSVTGKLFIKISDGPAPYEYESFMASGNLPRYLFRSAAVACNYFNYSDRLILLIEGGRIDHACHSGSISNCIYETNGFFETAEAIYNWLSQKKSYLMIIVADHETGGLNILNSSGPGVFPNVEWTSSLSEGVYSHTATDVPVYIYSDRLTGSEVNFIKTNTDIYYVIRSFLEN